MTAQIMAPPHRFVSEAGQPLLPAVQQLPVPAHIPGKGAVAAAREVTDGDAAMLVGREGRAGDLQQRRWGRHECSGGRIGGRRVEARVQDGPHANPCGNVAFCLAGGGGKGRDLRAPGTGTMGRWQP